MDKTRKTKLYVILIVLVCLMALCLCACAGGADGMNGANGKSAYEIWLEEGHAGSQADFLEWLKGSDGNDGANGQNGADGNDGSDGVNGLSAYDIFLKYYPYYTGTEEQWINSVAKGELKIHKVTFKSEGNDDIYRFVFEGYELTDIPEVPEKEGQTSAAWSITDFSSITQDTEVTAVYDMRKYVTFHNEFTSDEDIVKVVEYSEALTDIPQITEKYGNDGYWSVSDLGEIKTDLRVEAVYETQGLQYTLLSDNSYKVARGDMDYNTSELFIPAEHDGQAVTIIDNYAFNNVAESDGQTPNSNLVYVFIPDSIVEIQEGAFRNCNALKEIKIPDSVKTIGKDAFCKCFSLEHIDLGNGVTYIGVSAFWNCMSLTTIEIPNSVTSIGGSAFLFCFNLMSVVLYKTTSVSENAFQYCNALNTIYFHGDNSEFNAMNIDHEGNDVLFTATLYLYSETAPTSDGDYWHYDTDGKTPIAWVKQN